MAAYLLELHQTKDLFFAKVRVSAAADFVAIPTNKIPYTNWALQMEQVTGAPTAWNAYLQLSLSGINYNGLIQHINTSHTVGQLVRAKLSAAIYAQLYLSSITLGSASALDFYIIGSMD